jgi:hypothetical protein
MENNTEDIWTKGWRMFTSSNEEKGSMMVGMGTAQISQDGITFHDYPFAPSIACRQERFRPADIIDISVTGTPMSVQVNRELIFVPAENKTALLSFANAHHIPLVSRSYTWSWILEPFLDTEYSEETDRRLTILLAETGLSEEKVFTLRQEVKTQMLKYNFDTMLWEWVSLDLVDVLCAMRTKYDAQQFSNFYWRAMEIALM